MGKLAIRAYVPGDREAVHRIAADTAFFGEAVERYLDDRRLFCDALYRYYTDLEPQHGWVACADDVVVGFLMGCVDTSEQRRSWARKILPHVASRLLTGRYEVGTRTLRHAARIARAGLYTGPTVDLAKYPAHLHLNIQERWRGLGLGRRLLEAFLGQLRTHGIPGVHLNTTSLNSAAGALYESMGFRAANTHPAPQWTGLVPAPVFKVCYVLQLSPNPTTRHAARR